MLQENNPLHIDKPLFDVSSNTKSHSSFKFKQESIANAKVGEQQQCVYEGP